jgi:transcription initiation factor TFIID TATA-box-binding protein
MKVKVENIVAIVRLDSTLDLEKIMKRVSGVENPRRFPGLIYRVNDLKLAFLIFRTGKFICSGAKDRKTINKAIKILMKKLWVVVRPKSKPKVEIVNMVSSADLGFMVHLDKLAVESWNVEYSPETFPGLVYRLDNPKTVMLIFRSGKIIITGATSPEDAQKAAEKTRDMIKDLNAVLS